MRGPWFAAAAASCSARPGLGLVRGVAYFFYERVVIRPATFDAVLAFNLRGFATTIASHCEFSSAVFCYLSIFFSVVELSG